ncbi:MAG: hypothetical protein ACLFPE_12240 [Bacteroidales bacterium]
MSELSISDPFPAAGVLQRALSRKGLLSAADTAVIFQDLDAMEERLDQLKKFFPEHTLHAIAIKAMPLPPVLRKIGNAGAGLEAASLPELVLALKSGVQPTKIVFDSPVKTREEIEFALRNQVLLNADSLDEIHRIAEIHPHTKTKSIVGLRINPQVGEGRISITSVAGDYSKFGVPLKTKRQEIIKAYHDHEWLTGIHLHVGSQGCELPLLVNGVKAVADLALEINRELKAAGKPNRISTFDIGGGLPVAYSSEDNPPLMQDYVAALSNKVPELFDGTFHLITEFGRWVHVNSGFAVSRVEYVKDEIHPGGPKTAMIHLGADMFIRECYLPEQWTHRLSVTDQDCTIKSSGEAYRYMIAGPLCFQGDIIARNVLLPEIRPADWIIIHDTGGYTLSMWSRYNSRQIPKVIGYRHGGDHFEILREREKPEDLWAFWG